MEITNKHGITISKQMLIKYFERLKNGFFKIIPIAEGKSYVTKQIDIPVEEANQTYHKYVENFIVEICGGFYLFDESEYFLALLANLEGLNKINNDELEKIKIIVFQSIEICKKMIRETNRLEE